MIDILAILVIIADISVAGFLIWRAVTKKATLWGTARLIYWYVALLTIYHGVVYAYSLIQSHTSEAIILYAFLHPVVLLYIANPLLIAIIHYKGGHLL